MGPVEEDYIETVLTCEGDYYDPQFHTQLQNFSDRLRNLITTQEKQKLIIKKVEPWNSVRVTFNIPKEAASRLKHLAEQGDQTLRQLGILEVQIEGDRLISLTIAGKNNERTELVFHTAGPGTGAGASSLFDVSGSDEPGPSNVEATRKNIAQYLSQQGGPGNIFDNILNHAGSSEKAHSDPLLVPGSQGQFPFGSPNRGPASSVGMQMPFAAGRSPTGFPSSSGQLQQSYPSPSLARSHANPGSPKFSNAPPQMLHTSTAGSRPGQVNYQLPFPHGNPNVNNLQRLVASGGKDITSSSPLLVNLLQSDVAAGHFNNLPHHRLGFPFEPAGAAVKRKRRPRKNKDGASKVPKFGDGEEASVPLPGTFPGMSSQQQVENRVPPMGMEAALYHVPNTLAATEPSANATSSSGAQVHTPPLVERSHGNQGGPSSNQVSPTSSATLSVSTPSPVRTTPERSLANSGMQQIINPYTGQLESVENSPSDKTPTKQESSSDSATSDIPAQLQPPPNPLVALETRLVAEKSSLPSQLPSSPKAADSAATGASRSVQQGAPEAVNTAGSVVSGPNSATVPPPPPPPPPPPSSVHHPMQSKLLTTSSSPVATSDVRNNGASPVMAPHQRPGFRPSVPPATAPRHVTSLAPSKPVQSRPQHHPGPSELNAMPRLAHEQHLNPMQRLAESVSGMMRPLPSGMGHPDLRLRMPPHHRPHAIPPHMTAERPAFSNYSNMPRPQAQGMQAGVSAFPMHGGTSGGPSRAVMPGHPRMPHPQQQHMQHPGLVPGTSASHLMAPNDPSTWFSHASTGTSKSVIANQLMRPSLAGAGAAVMSSPSVVSTGTAQITHPAIASQLSQNKSSTKMPSTSTAEPVASGTTDAQPTTVAAALESVPPKVTSPVQGTSTAPGGEPANPAEGSVDKAQEAVVTNDSSSVSSLSQEAGEERESKEALDASSGADSSQAAASTLAEAPSLSPTSVQVDAVNKDDSVQVSSQLTISANSSSLRVGHTESACEDSQVGATKSEVKDSKASAGEKDTDPEQSSDAAQHSASGKPEESSETVDASAVADEVRNGISPLLDMPPSEPSGSQESDSPPTTASPVGSDSTPILDNCREGKLSSVSKLQPSPPHVRTTVSAIAMHNDLHSLVRGSNGASTGEASPASDNLSSTSQQNYGQSPLGNNVGLHMNHDSELSSQSFDDNSFTPPHTQVVGVSHATTAVIQENHSDSATKSKEGPNASSSSDPLPKDHPASTKSETKNIITVGYAVSTAPEFTKELSAEGLKSLDDIPYLKKPTVQADENDSRSKGISLATDFLDKPLQNMGTDKSENISKESLNYRGQVPLFSKTMETCDLNPGGLDFQSNPEKRPPLNGDVSDIDQSTSNAITAERTESVESVDEKKQQESSKCASSSNVPNVEDADVPGESVDKDKSAQDEIEAESVDVKEATENEEQFVDSATPENVEKRLVDDANDVESVPNPETPSCPQPSEGSDVQGDGSDEQTNSGHGPKTAGDEHVEPPQVEAVEQGAADAKQVTATAAASGQAAVAVAAAAALLPEAIEVTAASSRAALPPPRQTAVLVEVEANVADAPTTATASSSSSTSTEPAEPASVTTAGGLQQITTTKSEPVAAEADTAKLPAELPAQIISASETQVEPSDTVMEAAVKTTQQQQRQDPEPSALKDQPCRPVELTGSVVVTAVQLPSLSTPVESKLSVTVVNNSPPTTGPAALNKSISPVIKAVSSSKPVDIVTSVTVGSTVTETARTTVSKMSNVLYTASVTAPIVSTSAANIAVQSKDAIIATKVPSRLANPAVVNSSDSSAQPETPVRVSVSSRVTPAANDLEFTAQAQTLPAQAKICIVSTVGNTKVAIHTLNSVPESNAACVTGGGQRTVAQPGGSSQGDVLTKVVPSSVLVKDQKMEAVSDSSRLSLHIIKSKVQAAQSEQTAQSKLLPQELIASAQQQQVANRAGHYNMQHAGGVGVRPGGQRPHEHRDSLQDRIESIVNASQGKALNTSVLSSVAALGNAKGTSIQAGPPVQGKSQHLPKALLNAVDPVEARTAPSTLTPSGPTPAAHNVNAARGNHVPPPASNLDSGTATAAIQAVAAQVKAAQGSAPQQQQHAAPPTAPEQKRSHQSKGVSILKPLFDREVDELDDSEMEPNTNVAHSQTSPLKATTEASVSKKQEDGASRSKTYDSTAFSIAQILDHAKRAMAEERQQKELKASMAKDKSKSSTGKGTKTAKQTKSPPQSKTPTQGTVAGTANPKSHDFPFSSSVHLANFVQKSKQTPSAINSAVRTPAHPITAPEFHLNLTESVQKVMQAIPGSEALSPPPLPPKVVRPGSLFTKFSEEKAAAGTESAAEPAPAAPASAVSIPAAPAAVAAVPVTSAAKSDAPVTTTAPTSVPHGTTAVSVVSPKLQTTTTTTVTNQVPVVKPLTVGATQPVSSSTTVAVAQSESARPSVVTVSQTAAIATTSPVLSSTLPPQVPVVSVTPTVRVTVPATQAATVTASSHAPVISHKISPSLPLDRPLTVSPISPGNKTLTSPRKAPTPPVAPHMKVAPAAPVSLTALRNTTTPPTAAAVIPVSHQVLSRKTPTPPAATVSPVVVRKAPTPPSAMPQPRSNVRVLSPHAVISRNAPSLPYSRNTPTPPGTSTVIHSRSPQSTPPAKEIPKMKAASAGVKFEIMPQPHGASTIVVIKSDSKDTGQPPTSDGTQTIILGHKDLIRKTTVCGAGKSENVTLITAHKSEGVRKVATPVIVTSTPTVASSAGLAFSHIPVQRQPITSPPSTPRVQQPGAWKRTEMTVPVVRGTVPQLTQIPRMSTLTSVVKSLPLQSRIVQSKPITAITVVNPSKAMGISTPATSLSRPATTAAIVASNEVTISTSASVPEPAATTTPVRLLVTTVKPSAAEAKLRQQQQQQQQSQQAAIDAVPTLVDVKQQVKMPTAVHVKPAAATAAPSIVQPPKTEPAEPEPKVPVKRGSRKQSPEKDLEPVEQQEQPNNNNKNEKTARKVGDGGHCSDETPRPARVNRRRSRESTESQQSTANSESGRSTRSSRKRGASESSDVSISSDGHNADVRSTPSARSSVDRSESPPKTAKHSTRSSTRKQTSAEREEKVVPEKERSVSPAPGKGTRASKRKLALEEATDDSVETKKAKVEAKSEQSSGKDADAKPADGSRRAASKQDSSKGASSSKGEASGASSAKRPGGRAHKTEPAEVPDDHTYSGSRRANTRSLGNAAAEHKEETVNKKVTGAAKKEEKATTNRGKGKQQTTAAAADAAVAAEEKTEAGAKRSTRGARVKDRTELPPPSSAKRPRTARDS